VTADEPLLVHRPTGWGWGSWKGHDHQYTTICCVVARALGRPVAGYSQDAARTRLGRRLTPREADAIRRADMDVATDKDRDIILRLAKRMGVAP